MKTTKQELLLRVYQLERDNTALHIALIDCINAGTVTWFHKGRHRVGITRPTACHGGIVIHSYREETTLKKWYSTVHYWEVWFDYAKQLSSDKDGMDLREAAFQAQTFVFREQNMDALEKANQKHQSQ